MTRGEAVALLRGRLAGRISRPSLDAWIVSELNAAQILLEMGPLWPWFLHKSLGNSVTLTADQSTFTLPEDWLCEIPEAGNFHLVFDGTFICEIEKAFLEDIRDGAPIGTTSGAPTKYNYIGQNLYVRPAPDKAYEVRGLYVAKDTAISALQDDTETNKWLTWAGEVVVNRAGATISNNYIKDRSLAEYFSISYQDAYKRLEVMHEHHLGGDAMPNSGLEY